MVYRVYVEKKNGFDHEASSLTSEVRELLELKKVEKIRVVNRYDVEDIDKELFDYAVNNGEASKENSIMIGDNIDADVRGALNAGMDAIYFNVVGAEKPSDVPHMIVDLKELQEIF